jgi:hypothetical protein
MGIKIMFLSKNYVLASEVVDLLGLSIANISNIRRVFENSNDFHSIKKMKDCVFLNVNCNKFSKNITRCLETNTFTDMSNKLPVSWVREEYGMTPISMIKSGISRGEVIVQGKRFIEFEDEFVSLMQNKIGYVLDEKETNDCFRRGLIEGYIKLGTNKYFTWYNQPSVDGREVRDIESEFYVRM